MNQIASESLVVSGNMLDSLRGTKPWVRFISVLGFIGSIITLLVGIGIVLSGAHLPYFGRFSRFGGVIYIILAVVQFFPCLFLFRYAGAIRRVLEAGNAAAWEQALHFQRSFWRYVGIMVLVFLVLEIIVIFAAFVMGLVVAAAH